MSSNTVNGSRIQFSFRKALNLRRKNGEPPNAAVYAKYKKQDTRGKTTQTAFRRDRNPVWDENTNVVDGMTLTTEIKFVVVDSSNPMLPVSRIATSKPYTMSELLALRDGIEASKSDEGFSVPLEFSSGIAGHAASLILSVRDFKTTEERQRYLVQVKTEWQTKNKTDLGEELASLKQELAVLSTDIPTTANAKTIIDMALAYSSFVAPALNNPIVDEDRTILSLIMAYRLALTRVGDRGAEASADLTVQQYGELCLKIITSLRLLEHYLRKPLNLRLPENVEQLDKHTKSFENFGLEVDGGTYRPGKLFARRVNHRKSLIAANTSFPAKLNPILDMEPPQIYQIRSRHTSPMVQLASTWVLSSSHPEPKRLLWVHGSQGCGKTQLASSLADAFGSMDIVGTYFTFCAESPLSSANTARALHSMIGTLAFQLAAYNAELTEAISDALDTLPNLDEMEFKEAFTQLIIDPLRQISTTAKPGADERTPRKPIFIILDDVDQCAPAELDELLSVLSDELGKFPKFARILVLSRELSAMRTAFEGHDLAAIQEFTTAESTPSGSGGVTPTSPIFGFRTAAGAAAASSRTPAIKWAGGHSRGSSSSSGSKGKRTSGSGSLGSIHEVQILEVPRDAPE